MIFIPFFNYDQLWHQRLNMFTAHIAGILVRFESQVLLEKIYKTPRGFICSILSDLLIRTVFIQVGKRSLVLDI